MKKPGCIADNYKTCMTPNIHTTHLLFSHCFQMFLYRPKVVQELFPGCDHLYLTFYKLLY